MFLGDLRRFLTQIYADMNENDLSYIVRGAIFKVYNNLGPGLLESVYEFALAFELRKVGLKTECQRPFPVVYEGNILETGFRLDIIVENKVILEIKSVEALADVHHKQLLTYLKITGVKLGLLINFNSGNMNGSIIRIVNKL
jgi:GxxExxY protein